LAVNAAQLPVALLAFVAILAMIPPWMHFIGEFSAGMPTASAWIARFTFPAVVLLFVGSWVGRDAA